jgi:hypothetical protein
MKETRALLTDEQALEAQQRLVERRCPFGTLRNKAMQREVLVSDFGAPRTQLLIDPSGVLHHSRRWPALQELAAHEFHVWSDMMKEPLVGRAEIVQSRLTVLGRHEAMFGALSVAGKADIAFAAIARQRITLGGAKAQLFV